MNKFGLAFHHLGLAVRRSEVALSMLGGLGYEAGEPLFDPEQNVNLCMCTHTEMPDVEVIFPGKGKGPIDALVGRHANGIVYHTCYTTGNLELTLAALKEANIGFQCVAARKPAVLFGGEHVSFYMISGLGLMEILEVPADQEARQTT